MTHDTSKVPHLRPEVLFQAKGSVFLRHPVQNENGMLYLKPARYGHCVVLFMPKTDSLRFRLSPAGVEYVTGSVTVEGIQGMSSDGWKVAISYSLFYWTLPGDSVTVSGPVYVVRGLGSNASLIFGYPEREYGTVIRILGKQNVLMWSGLNYFMTNPLRPRNI